MIDPLTPGATIGILGGGQLGRMLSVAAARLGFVCHIYEPGNKPPAGQVAQRVTTARYDDHDALKEFARSVDVITFEFENIPSAALDILESITPVRPNRRALAISQDRLNEKEFLNGLGLITAPFAPVETLSELHAAIGNIGTPAILKTRRFGYDGKGQVRLSGSSDLEVSHAELAGAPGLLEGFVDFRFEVSVIGARGVDGQVACFDPGENIHQDGILHSTNVPANLTAAQRMDAVFLTANIMNELDYVGVLGVELFVTKAGFVVNEIAPRVHNSGHWTQNGCAIDQFEQHIRAVSGWPLGDGQRHSDVEMINLIGSDVDGVSDLANDGASAIHLYGKSAVKPGRKMGHVNRVKNAKGNV